MFASGIKRALAIALLAAPIPVFANDNSADRNQPTTVTVNAGQGGFVAIPIVPNTDRTYALTGARSYESRVINYRYGQGDVLIRVPK